MCPAIHRVCLLLAGVLVVACGPALAPAYSIDVSLNLIYSSPFDDTSGGTWQIAAKSDGFGIYGLQLLLTGVTAATPVGPTGTVNGSDAAGFSEYDSFSHGTYREIVLAQIPVVPLGPGDEQSIIYDVGTLANGSPTAPGYDGPAFTSLTGTSGIPWATGDVFGDSAWDIAAVLLTGTFASGQTPGFYAGSDSSGNVFTSVGTSTTVGSYASVDPIATMVRDNLLPSPPGDYNGNGAVDAADYTVWRDHLNETFQLANEDPTVTPGEVTEDDYVVWKAHFGEVSPGPGAGAASGASLSVGAVPEPASWVLLAGAAGTLFLSGIRRVSR
jgi:hypothetical protein